MGKRLSVRRVDRAELEEVVEEEDQEEKEIY
jgi:hypothetical protein